MKLLNYCIIENNILYYYLLAWIGVETNAREIHHTCYQLSQSSSLNQLVL